MLVITRKPGEGFLIGDDITVRILEDNDGRIRVGIEAPKEKKIYREEVYERIRQENKHASQWQADDWRSLAQQLVKPPKKASSSGTD
ncbi:carbon storage regulator CsrA [Desulfohalobium retbaense]|uniref:Translational regulator CsrA n=1 Tax=Desulfohalobium retbaense (strain ATCC 49708 / DSM 5692 / JCM 16813 / HR100) TaxID=485915 RepID=C8WYY5_DESRD|nr:carbon storage regulator CsrA [Desulfohalobium retbaense]ACV67901.1 carbon storage regulator, CsrA [Desulfohalobium retbaense DSM 5692]